MFSLQRAHTLLRNNQRAKEHDDNDSSDENLIEPLRDQGYTLPTVLELLPTRGTCHTFLRGLKRALGDAASVEHLDRFDAEHGPPPAIEDESGIDVDARRRRTTVQEAKIPAWNELFSDNVNSDDDFKIGLSISPKAAGATKSKQSAMDGNVSMKLYTDFYRIDIMLASPLARKMVTNSGGEPNDDTDFLASIEIFLLSQAEVLLMQIGILSKVSWMR